MLFADLAGDVVAAIGIFDGHVMADGGRFTLPLRRRLHAERLFLRAVIAVRVI